MQVNTTMILLLTWFMSSVNRFQSTCCFQKNNMAVVKIQTQGFKTVDLKPMVDITDSTSIIYSVYGMKLTILCTVKDLCNYLPAVTVECPRIFWLFKNKIAHSWIDSVSTRTPLMEASTMTVRPLWESHKEELKLALALCRMLCTWKWRLIISHGQNKSKQSPSKV